MVCVYSALSVSVCEWVYLCVLQNIWLTISAYFSLQQRIHPPTDSSLSVCAELYMTEASFFSLPSFLCFPPAVVTTSSIVEWITERLELVRLIFACKTE